MDRPSTTSRTAIIVLVPGEGTISAARTGDWPCDVRSSDRIVAVGDVHGAYDQFVAMLRTAGVIDQRQRWAGGRTILVQTGDVLDRGPDSRKVLDLLRRLQGEAARAGGGVYALLGNHEFMRLSGDWRYVSSGELRAFADGGSERLRDAYQEQFGRAVPLGALEMGLAFNPAGDYGRWVRGRPAVVKVNGIIFVHGGISESTAALGCPGINDAVHAEMMSLPVAADRRASLLATSDTGPLWYRGLATAPEAALAAMLDRTLQQLQARAIVIGHTTVLPGAIRMRLGGRVVQIDSGMLGGEFYPGGIPSALEITGNAFTAIYPDHRELLETMLPHADIELMPR